MNNIELLRKFIIEAIEEEIHEETEEPKLPKQYGAPKGSERAAGLDKAASLYKSGNIKAAAAVRKNMDEK